ncbi:MAG: RagB/SusD family nutrient uptake outer membrane protein [Odoribacter sp.]|nr:RagB/SusD family nutrient uptake outer membrane protein [Odoribacter sp.]
MRKIFKYICISSMLFLSSCSSWLDVQPFDQVSEDKQYSKAEGFYNQLNGIYKSLATKELYGQELSWGILDVVAQYYLMGYYSECENHAYWNASSLEYEDEKVRPYIDAIWEKMYRVVANCNNLIQNTACADSTIFPDKEAERRCIEGEARALRAMIHFDLLRMFAPAPTVDTKGKYIPYVDKFPTHVPIHISTAEVLDKIEEDLELAHTLTADYDTIHSSEISRISNRLLLNGGTGFMTSRGYRLNHYAIKALLARFSLYKGDKEKAILWASDIVKYQSWFKFSSEYDIVYNDIVKLYGDVIFAFYNNNATLYEEHENDGDSRLQAWDLDALFGSSDVYDVRRHQWDFEESVPLKIKKVTGNSRTEICNVMIPMIRISEMYYILAECYFEKDKKKAAEFLDYVRKSRECTSVLPNVDTQKEFNKLILQDFRREMYGEGQLFFFYKRLKMDAIGDASTTVEYGTRYVFPIPESNDI